MIYLPFLQCSLCLIISHLLQVFTHRITPAELKQINEAIPKITIMSGDHDNLVNPGNSKHLKQHLPAAELHLIQGGGHAMTIQ